MDTIALGLWAFAGLAALVLACWAVAASGRASSSRAGWRIQEMVGGSSITIGSGQAAEVGGPAAGGSRAVTRLEARSDRLLVSTTGGAAGRALTDASIATVDDVPLSVSRADSLSVSGVPTLPLFGVLAVFAVVWSQLLFVGPGVALALLAWLAVAAGLAHMLEDRGHRAPGLMVPAAFLTVVGVLVQARLGGGDRHLVHAWIALAVFAAVALVCFRRGELSLRRRGWLLVGLALQTVAFVPGLGVVSAGSTLSVQFATLSVQPAELARVMLIGYFGAFLAAWRFHLRSAGPVSLRRAGLPPGGLLLPLLVAGSVSIALQAAHRDFGPSVILYGSVVAVAAVITEQRRYLLFGLVGLVAGMAVVAAVSSRERDRVLAWVGRGDSDQFQLRAANAAARRGGLFGTGPGNLLSALDTPLVENDMVIAAVAEIGGVLLLGVVAFAFGSIVVSATTVFRVARGPQLGGIAVALGLAIGVGAVVNAACVLRLFPLTGVPLPFVSAGGSSLVSTWLALGLISAAGSHVRVDRGTEGGRAR